MTSHREEGAALISTPLLILKQLWCTTTMHFLNKTYLIDFSENFYSKKHTGKKLKYQKGNICICFCSWEEADCIGAGGGNDQ